MSSACDRIHQCSCQVPDGGRDLQFIAHGLKRHVARQGRLGEMAGQLSRDQRDQLDGRAVAKLHGARVDVGVEIESARTFGGNAQSLHRLHPVQRQRPRIAVVEGREQAVGALPAQHDAERVQWQGFVLLVVGAAIGDLDLFILKTALPAPIPERLGMVGGCRCNAGATT